MLMKIIYSKSYPLLNNQVFQCGTGKGTSILQLSQLVSEVIGRKTNLDFGALEYRDRDIMYSVANFEKASSILGWYPKMDLRDQISKIKFLTENHEVDTSPHYPDHRGYFRKFLLSLQMSLKVLEI